MGKAMNKAKLYPALVTVASVISAIVFRNPFTYFNIFLSAVTLYIGFYAATRNPEHNKIMYSALVLLILELTAFVLLLFNINFYETLFVWMMYAVLILFDAFITPRLNVKP